MVVYIEPVFAENMLIDYFVLLLCGKITYCRCRHPWLASALGGVFACVMPLWSGFDSLWFKAVSLSAVSFVCFLPKTVKGAARQVLYTLALFGGLYGIITVISGGSVEYGFFYNPSKLMIVSFGSLLISVVAYRLASAALTMRNICENSVTLELCGNTFQAIVDSGNSLYYNNIPVVLVNSEKLSSELMSKPLVIPYSAVGKNGAMLGFLAKNAVLYSEKGKREVKCVVALCETDFGDGVSALVHPDLIKENS